MKGRSIKSALKTMRVRVVTYHNIPVDAEGIPKGLGIEVLDEIVCLLVRPPVSHLAVQIVRRRVAPSKRFTGTINLDG